MIIIFLCSEHLNRNNLNTHYFIDNIEVHNNLIYSTLRTQQFMYIWSLFTFSHHTPLQIYDTIFLTISLPEISNWLLLISIIDKITNWQNNWFNFCGSNKINNEFKEFTNHSVLTSGSCSYCWASTEVVTCRRKLQLT